MALLSLALAELSAARPSPELLAALGEPIASDGMSDAKAAILAGVKPRLLKRWMREDEEVALAIRRARAAYCRRHRRETAETGAEEWRAHVWLLESAGSEDAEEDKALPDEMRLHPALVFSEADLAAIQAGRLQTLKNNAPR